MKTLRQLCKDLDECIAKAEAKKSKRKLYSFQSVAIRKAMRKLEKDKDVEWYMSKEFLAV